MHWLNLAEVTVKLPTDKVPGQHDLEAQQVTGHEAAQLEGALILLKNDLRMFMSNTSREGQSQKQGPGNVEKGRTYLKYKCLTYKQQSEIM